MPGQPADLVLLEHTLDRVAEHIGDPAPQVFERLFARWPELQGQFCNDPAGSVRGEMFHRALECLLDAAATSRFVAGFVSAQHIGHLDYGVSTVQFMHFFDTLVEVFKDALGDEWTPQIDAAWDRAVNRMHHIVGHQATAG